MNAIRTLFSVLVTTALVACSSIEMPKGTSKGYSSARFFVVGGEVTPMFMDSSVDVNGTIQSAVREEFESQGIVVRETAKEDADLVIGYLLLTQDAVTTASIDAYFGYGPSSEISDLAHKKREIDKNQRAPYGRGAIVIDILDTRTNELVYRNAAVRDYVEGLSKDEREARIRQAVAEALQDFFRS